MGKNGLVHLLFFAFMLLSRFAFLLLFCFLFFQGKKQKKQNKSKIKAKLESKINAKKMQMANSMFSLFDVPFFPHLFCFRFFSFEVLLFDFPCVFLFLHCFQV